MGVMLKAGLFSLVLRIQLLRHKVGLCKYGHIYLVTTSLLKVIRKSKYTIHINIAPIKEKLYYLTVPVLNLAISQPNSSCHWYVYCLHRMGVQSWSEWNAEFSTISARTYLANGML